MRIGKFIPSSPSLSAWAGCFFRSCSGHVFSAGAVFRRRLFGCLLALGILILFATGTRAAEETNGAIVTVRALQPLIVLPAREVVQVSLSGLVLGIDPVHAGIALQDNSGSAWVNLESLQPGIQPGVRISLRGGALVGKGSAQFGFSRLIDINYASGSAFDSARIPLSAGNHPFELSFSQNDGPSALELRIVSPTQKRLNLTNVLSFVDPVDGRRKPGVTYRYTEVADRNGSVTNVIDGVASSIDLAIARQSNHFAIQFKGELKIVETGYHEIQLQADDAASFAFPSDTTFSVDLHERESLPQPLQLVPGQRYPPTNDPCWAEVEGYVKQAGSHGSNLHLELAAEVGRIQVTIAGANPVPAALLVNSRVRLTGLVYGTLPPGQPKVAGAMIVPGIDNLVILNPPETIWMGYAATKVSDLGAPGANRIVRIRGTVVEVVPGRKLVVRDDTGHVEAMTPRADRSMQNSAIDLLGCYSESNRLHFVSHRSETQPGLQQEILPVLTTIEQIRRLRPEEVTRSYPVKFQGVVTFVFDGGLRAHVQGEREGIYVACVRNAPQPVNVGDLCEFEGISSKGAFSPVVTYRVRHLLGRGHVPEPTRPEWNQLANGSLDSQWIEVEALVLSVNGRDLALGLPGGELPARVFDGDPAELKSLQDSVVRIRGTVRGFANARGVPNRVLLQVTSPAQITVLDPAPEDPFSIPERSFAELHEFDANAAALRRVRCRGQVVHVRDDVAYLFDGTNALQVFARSAMQLTPGDLVEVVGFPQMENFVLSMRQALVRVTGHVPLPAPRIVSEDDIFNENYESSLVQLQAVLVNVRTNESDYLIELQAGRQTFLARLDSRRGSLGIVPVGSKVRIAGLYTTGLNAPNRTNQVRTFELLLNSPDDLTVVETPSWWNVQRVLSLLGLMTLVLVLSAVWIGTLRRRVELRTRELREEIEVRTRTQQDLEEKKARLENEIEERRRIEQEVEKVNQQLVHASRLAGQAEVASSVLHNVGNVLNSVNVSASVVASGLHNWKTVNLIKAADLLRSRSTIFESLPKDDSVRLLPDYLEKLAAHSDSTRAALIKEVTDLTQNVDHIKKIVVMQQNYAKVSGVSEVVHPSELMESAFKINARSYERHGIRLERRFSESPEITTDRHKVLQILVNLFKNAKDACKAKGRGNHTVVARIGWDGESVVFEVSDTGIGISEENIKLLFSHGFTTRRDGHGFGLHSAALATKELGGTITAFSAGVGFGATFTLRIPVAKTAPQPNEAAPV